MLIPVTAATTALLALLMVALAARVSHLRRRESVAFGDGGNPALMRAIRLHGNTAEHVPVFLFLVLSLELMGGAQGLLVGTAGAFMAGRLVFCAGLILRGKHVLRMAGAGITYLAQAVLAVALLWRLPATIG